MTKLPDPPISLFRQASSKANALGLWILTARTSQEATNRGGRYRVVIQHHDRPLFAHDSINATLEWLIKREKIQGRR